MTPIREGSDKSRNAGISPLRRVIKPHGLPPRRAKALAGDGGFKVQVQHFLKGRWLRMPGSYIHLELSERALIETQLRLGLSPACIAAGLKRARSTVLREIRRNGWKPPSELACQARRIAGGYRCVLADRRARVLAHRARRPRKLLAGNQLWTVVVDHLRQGLSPAQIARTLARMDPPERLCYETIYTAFYAMPRGQLRASLLGLLRHRRHVRGSPSGKQRRSRPSMPDMTLIDQRPLDVQMRLVPGHWEGDLIIGKGNLSQVGTLVERTTLFVALVKLNSTKPDATVQAFTQILNRFDSQLRRSMTYDQGSEMRYHRTLTRETGVAVYFAHPHAPWERENQRKYQRPAAPVPAQRHRPVAVLPAAARRHRMAAQHQAEKNPGMESTRRTLPPRRRLRLRATLVTENIRCTCTLNPPTPVSPVEMTIFRSY